LSKLGANLSDALQQFRQTTVHSCPLERHVSVGLAVPSLRGAIGTPGTAPGKARHGDLVQPAGLLRERLPAMLLLLAFAEALEALVSLRGGQRLLAALLGYLLGLLKTLALEVNEVLEPEEVVLGAGDVR